ncbi:MAG: ribosome small subunit-dependent GTPase A [Bacteroidetes bacterium]|nr:ribosome small subunit-dependent GTPase A [Bacteroidota bacterium]MBS1981471.1 ribosome small subunit-dependent GTPase A [Bacteroidota bacterium]
MTGVVTKSTGSWYDVWAGREKYECRIRGKIRLEGIKETNPVAVGDWVKIELENEANVITGILPRKNHILRQSVKKTAHSNILAANIDQAILVVTLHQPRTSLGFIDRFLVSAEAFRIPQLLIFNKTDLLDEEQLIRLSDLQKRYEALGIATLRHSALIPSGIDNFKNILEGKISLVAGHSGVGKSTLLNQTSDLIQQTTKEISSFSEKGTHTTTFAEMFQLNEHTAVIDTPGIKEWGLVDMTPQEISDYFPEMRDLRLECKFGSKCLHWHEPGCAVKKAVEEGTIWESRYENYFNMVTGSDNRK